MRTTAIKTVHLMIAGMIFFAACSSLSRDNFQNPEKAAESQLAVPQLLDRVMDLAGILRDTEAADLRAKLKQLETDTTAQMAILIIPDLQGEALEKYSLRVARTWKLGRKDLNNGILILVAMRDRALRIEIGTGLETVLSNEICKGIIDNEMIPLFKKGEYYQGLDKGVGALISLLDLQQRQQER